MYAIRSYYARTKLGDDVKGGDHPCDRPQKTQQRGNRRDNDNHGTEAIQIAVFVQNALADDVFEVFAVAVQVTDRCRQNTGGRIAVLAAALQSFVQGAVTVV